MQQKKGDDGRSLVYFFFQVLLIYMHYYYPVCFCGAYRNLRVTGTSQNWICTSHGTIYRYGDGWFIIACTSRYLVVCPSIHFSPILLLNKLTFLVVRLLLYRTPVIFISSSSLDIFSQTMGMITIPFVAFLMAATKGAPASGNQLGPGITG